MTNLVDELVPVGTLILGAGLTWLSTGVQSTRSARREASDMLAGLVPLAWDQPDGWLNLQAYLGRLHGALRHAGVKPALIKRLKDATTVFWHNVEPEVEPGLGAMIAHKYGDPFFTVIDELYVKLDPSWWARLKR